MSKMFLFPSKNLVLSIPIVLILGFIAGLFVNTSFLKDYILILTFLMIYPTMIGFKLKEAVDLSHFKIVLLSFGINFLFIPAVAYGIGSLFLMDNPEMFAGIAMISLFPTSGMTISWTMLSKGNVPAAVKITAISLLLGSFLAPVYLFFMVGKIIEVNIIQTFITILQVVLIPLILGNLTFILIKKKYSQEVFEKKIKPFLPASSTWAMMLIVFISVSIKSKVISSNPSIILHSLGILLVFYIINFFTSTIIAKKTLKVADGFALLYGTVLRNLSIALGIAVASFGPNTALIVTLAFILQVQGAAWYGQLAPKYGWLANKNNEQAMRDGVSGC